MKRICKTCHYCKYYEKLDQSCYKLDLRPVDFNACGLFVHFNSRTNESDFARFLRLNRRLPF